jgi:hypothetical protein
MPLIKGRAINRGSARLATVPNPGSKTSIILAMDKTKLSLRSLETAKDVKSPVEEWRKGPDVSFVSNPNGCIVIGPDLVHSPNSFGGAKFVGISTTSMPHAFLNSMQISRILPLIFF